MNSSYTLFSSTPADSAPLEPSAAAVSTVSTVSSTAVPCPHCKVDIDAAETETEWQSCPHCGKELQIRVWPVVRQISRAATAISDQATCFFHPEKAFQACCQRCGRFVCALCDLHLGAEHVCPTCFERGRSTPGAVAAKAEWRYRDVLYDSIALTVGWGWILFYPTLIAAIPTVIVLHIKYRKAPRSYLIPRRGWRFWLAYVGLLWLPLLIGSAFVLPIVARRH